MLNLQKDITGDRSFETKVENLQNIFLKEKATLESNFQKEKISLQQNLDKQSDTLQLLQNQNKNYVNEVNELKSRISKLETLNTKYEKELEQTQDIRNNFNEELTKLNKITIDSYERILSSKEQEHQKEIEKLNSTSESTLNQLKTIFENEKNRLEEKLLQLKIGRASCRERVSSPV